MLIFRETLLPGYSFSHSHIHTHTLTASLSCGSWVEAGGLGVGCFLRDKK